jgi:hypothetical protein
LQIALYIADITVYADKAKNFIRQKIIGRCSKNEEPANGSLNAEKKVRKENFPAVIALFQETHMTKEECDEEAQELFVRGWKNGWNAGTTNEGETGVAGGTCIISSGVRIDFGMDKLRQSLGSAGEERQWQHRDISYALVHLEKMQFVVINAYLHANIGCEGINLQKLSFVAKIIKVLRMPFMVAADWNVTPEELLQSVWIRQAKGVVIKPPVENTCNAGRGAMLDFVVASPECAELIEAIEVDYDGSWRPHFGYIVKIKGKPVKYMVERIVKAKKKNQKRGDRQGGAARGMDQKKWQRLSMPSTRSSRRERKVAGN